MKVIVENLKCGGCVNSIKKGILSVDGVSSVEVNKDTAEVSVDGNFSEEQVLNKLDEMGYPANGHNSFLKKTKSFVSCAIGKFDA